MHYPLLRANALMMFTIPSGGTNEDIYQRALCSALHGVLAGHGGTEPVPLKEIAEATSISRKYLEQIASSLAAAQLVRSARGASGGYRLARSAMNITMLDVLTVAEGSLAPVDYLDELSGEASPGESCYEIFVWKGLHDLVKGYLGGISLQDVVDRSSQLAIDSYTI